MNIAGATFAVRRSGACVATVAIAIAIEEMRFLRPIALSDEVRCYYMVTQKDYTSVNLH